MLSRRWILIVAAVVLFGAIFVIYSSVRRETNRQAALGAAAKPFVDAGFKVVEMSERGDPTKLETNVDAGCIVVASATGAKLKLTHPAGIVEGDSPLLTCLCAGGAVSVSAPKEAGGTVLLRADAATIGGSRAYAYLPFKATTATNDAACAEASLDGWIDAKKYPAPAIDTAIFDSKPQLKKAGIEIAASIKPEWPFAVVNIPANDCLITVDDQEEDKVGLRVKGGSFALGPATGNLAYCTATATTVVVQRDGKGLVSALLTPAEKVGGFQGLREIAASAYFEIVNLGVPATDHDWIAKQLLLASDIPDSLIVVGRDAPDPDKDLRIASLSVEKVGMLTPETSEGVFSFCDPQLDAAAASLCVFSGPQTWKLERHDAITGLARAKLPFWLFGVKDVAEPAALKLATEVVTLARRLKRNNYEPTTFEGVTDNDAGVEVLGRANEDAIVVVTLAPVPPWVVTLADPGHSWELGSEPRAVPIQPLQRIELVPAPKAKLPPKAARRTVVFRHHA